MTVKTLEVTLDDGTIATRRTVHDYAVVIQAKDRETGKCYAWGWSETVENGEKTRRALEKKEPGYELHCISVKRRQVEG
jgi:hypothetical protein